MEALSIVAVVSVVWAVTAAMMMVGYLKNRGIKINFLWLRLYLPKYIHQYRKLTQAETGHVGALFYHFVIPINLALVLALTYAALSVR